MHGSRIPSGIFASSLSASRRIVVRRAASLPTRLGGGFALPLCVALLHLAEALHLGEHSRRQSSPGGARKLRTEEQRMCPTREGAEAASEHITDSLVYRGRQRFCISERRLVVPDGDAPDVHVDRHTSVLAEREDRDAISNLGAHPGQLAQCLPNFQPRPFSQPLQELATATREQRFRRAVDVGGAVTESQFLQSNLGRSRQRLEAGQTMQCPEAVELGDMGELAPRGRCFWAIVVDRTAPMRQGAYGLAEVGGEAAEQKRDPGNIVVLGAYECQQCLHRILLQHAESGYAPRNLCQSRARR
mmetsp:Transcript_39464/g.114236  ORF Transcript_39464/g.114236 Transcript_39464/m.114236 type:complete len:302 (+) Transcript_39464:1-906(+)